MTILDPEIFRQAIRERRLEWRKHVLQKLAERGISRADVLDVLLTGERLRDYEEDRPFPSALFFGYVAGKPLHVVAACDEEHRRAYVITAYEPSPEIFETDFKRKRKR